MYYCIDTNIIIEISRGNHNIKSQLEIYDLKKMCINPIIILELSKGAYLSNKPKETLQFIKELTKELNVLPFTEQTYNIYGEKYAELKRKGKQTPEFDLIIASICITHNASLITLNGKDFKGIKELNVIELVNV